MRRTFPSRAATSATEPGERMGHGLKGGRIHNGRVVELEARFRREHPPHFRQELLGIRFTGLGQAFGALQAAGRAGTAALRSSALR